MDVRGLELAVLAGCDLELNGHALVQGLKAVHLNLGVVDEQVVAILARDEAVALVRVEPLNSTLCHDVPFFRLPLKETTHCARAARNLCDLLVTCASLPHRVLGELEKRKKPRTVNMWTLEVNSQVEPNS